MCSPLHWRKSKQQGAAMEDEDVLQALFAKYSENGKVGAENLLQFLHQEQGEAAATLEDAVALLQQQRKEFNKLLPKLHSQEMKADSFLQYLLNPALNAPIDSTTVHQDMTQPLSQYYIYTGHNSYLTGNQLSSDSSDAPITAALRRGVRVVELDLWPDPDDGGIKVTHGKTLTHPVDFEKCIIAIKENAFGASQYPVCITLEDHLSCALQAKAAEILLRVLGDALYYPPSCEALKEFPSPESLKGRIIISTKPPKEYLEETGASNKEVVKELKQEDKQEEKKKSPAVKDETLSEKANKLHIDESVPPAPGHLVEDDGVEDVRNPEYARLITIRQVKPVKGTAMKDRLAIEEDVKRISLAEPKLEEVAQEFPELLVKFTQRNILRVYPSGVRVDSSNYNPVLAWNHGAQMVALNMQGYGKPLWLAHGLYRANGGCGYVRKPKFLIESGPDGALFVPRAPRPVKESLKVQVIMSQGWKEAFGQRHFDLFSPPDFFTKVAIAGVPADKSKHKTQPVEDTWCPRWNEEFEFALTVPELALLRVEVYDDDDESEDEFAGQTCLPVAELKSGYRCVQLYDKKGIELPGVTMLFHFQRTLH